MKRKMLDFILKNHPSYQDMREFFVDLNKATFDSFLLEFEQDGLIVKLKDKMYLSKELNLIPARIVSIKERFAFAAVSEEEEVFIAINNLKNAFIDDQVLIKKVSQSYQGKSEYEVIKITKRAREEVVGEVKIFASTKTLIVNNLAASNYLFLIQEKDIVVQQNQIIRAKIVKTTAKNCIVTPIEIIGNKMDIGVDISRIILSNNAPLNFPLEVEEEVKQIPSEVLKKDYKYREDFTNHLIVTIDGEDAKDFDDAVEVTKDGDLYHVGVHIADVSHYVKEKSEIDKEALNRATSLYVSDRVVPMLPFELSNGICSLNPHVDRLVTSCLFTVNRQGKIISSRLCKGVINSKHRLTYTYVNEFLSSQKKDKLTELENLLINLNEVASLIRKRRNALGAVSLSSTELNFKLNEEGVPSEVIKRKTGLGEQLIEDLMIAANEVVASTIEKRDLPMVYRIHENVRAKKLDAFKRIAMVKGYPFNVDPLMCRPKDVSNFINSIKDEKDKEILSNLLLMCLAKAKYSIENKKHFGLASESYTHFTSPIRRYPDLIVHRLINKYIVNQEKEVNEEFKASLHTKAQLCSQRERRALNIERSVESLLAAKYMKERLGNEYEAIIVSMITQGMFVELENGIQGFISFESLSGDYYIFDEAIYCAYGVRKGKTFHLGDKVNVICSNVDIEEAKITFVLLQNQKKLKIEKRGKEKTHGRKHKTYRK